MTQEARPHHRDTITISDHHVAVDTRDRGCTAHVVFKRRWSRVTLEKDLTRRLKQLIGRANESPLLAP